MFESHRIAEKMMKFVVYEVWTRHKIVEAPSLEVAYRISEPDVLPIPETYLCNWHIVPVEEK